VNELPEHTEPALADTVGFGLTVTLLTADDVLTQPSELVPITEYEVVTVGLTTADPPEKVYVLAPDGIIVNEFPVQMDPLLTEITGFGLTVTFDIATEGLTHPAVLVPITEYDAVMVGLITGPPPTNV
jgi:hypothetical protein